MSSEIPEYHPPDVLLIVGSLLSIPRESRSATFPDFFSSDTEAQKDYVKGLIALGTFIIGIAFVWYLILIVLKIKGREVGCASGYAFDTQSRETNPTAELRVDTSSEEYDDGFSREWNERREEALSPDSTLAVLQYPNPHLRVDTQRYLAEDATAMMMPPPSFTDEDSLDIPAFHAALGGDVRPPPALRSSHSSSPRRDTHRSGKLYSIPAPQRVSPNDNHDVDKVNDNGDTRSFWSSPQRNAIRQRRTRMAFWLFSAMSLTGSVLLFANTFYPFRNAASTTTSVVSDGHQVVYRIRRVLDIVVDASNNAEVIIESDLPVDSQLCPDVPKDDFNAQLGVDLQEVVTFATSEFHTIRQGAEANITMVENAMSDIDSALTNVEASIDEADSTLWILPFTLTISMVLTIVSVFGVLAAQADRSTTQFQKIQSCIVLPLFIVLTILCWTYVVGSSIGTVLTYDICTAETPTMPASPETTIQSILDAQNIRAGGMMYQLVTEYTSGCKGEDPIEDLVKLSETVAVRVDMVKLRLQQAEEIGFEILRTKCGEGNRIDEFFLAARLLDAHLTSIRDALASGVDTLACPRINELYRRTFHAAICTDVASANASGFVLFLVVTIANMSLITMRAAWRSL